MTQCLRLLFEPQERMEINKISVFEFYGGNYLSNFDAEFGGFISMNSLEKVGSRFEPVWQFLIRDHNPDLKEELFTYLNNNPLNGYHIHVYEHTIGNEKKVF